VRNFGGIEETAVWVAQRRQESSCCEQSIHDISRG
jgi:hypothetical protein